MKSVREFSLLCCTTMEHAWNTKIWAKIISAYAKKCSITGFSLVRGVGVRRGGGGWQKTQVYAFSGHERIEVRSDDGKALKILRLIPRGDARLPGGKTC